MNFFKLSKIVAAFLLLVPVAAQAQSAGAGGTAGASVAANYLIGPGDELEIFVWKNPDLSVTLPVRPDGRISTPLVADMQAQGKTPTDLAANLRAALGKYVQDPVVTVLVKQVAALLNLRVELAARLVVEELLALLRRLLHQSVLAALARQVLDIVKETHGTPPDRLRC